MTTIFLLDLDGVHPLWAILHNNTHQCRLHPQFHTLSISTGTVTHHMHNLHINKECQAHRYLLGHDTWSIQAHFMNGLPCWSMHIATQVMAKIITMVTTAIAGSKMNNHHCNSNSNSS